MSEEKRHEFVVEHKGGVNKTYYAEVEDFEIAEDHQAPPIESAFTLAWRRLMTWRRRF